jgi:hypothetical protein
MDTQQFEKSLSAYSATRLFRILLISRCVYALWFMILLNACSSTAPIKEGELHFLFGQYLNLETINDHEYQEYARKHKFYNRIFIVLEEHKSFQCVVPGDALLSEAQLQRGVAIPDNKIIGKGVFSFSDSKLFLKNVSCKVPAAFSELTCKPFYDNPHGIGSGYRLDCSNKRKDKLVFSVWSK